MKKYLYGMPAMNEKLEKDIAFSRLYERKIVMHF